MEAYPPVPDFDPDLFAGTARDYAQYRVAYPQPLIDDLVAKANISGRGALLDLGCGPGRVSLPLAKHFRLVEAIDQEPDMVEVGSEAAQRLGLKHVHFSIGRAENLTAPPKTFELVTAGEAFHRFDQRRVAARVLDWLRPGRCFATMGCYGITRGDAPWQHIVREVIGRWTDRQPRPPDPKPPPDAIPFHAVLQSVGFVDFSRHAFTAPHTWTPDSIIGNCYSTSGCSKRILGDKAADFEDEMRRRLLAYDERGVYEENVDFGYTLARRPKKQ